MQFMPEEIGKKNKKEIKKETKRSVPIKSSSKNLDTIAGIPEVDLLKQEDSGGKELGEQDSMSAEEIIASKPKKPELQGQPLFSWEAPEYPHYEKGTLWYIVVVILGLLALILSIIFRQWILILVIVLAIAFIIQFGRRKPQLKNFSIYENGIDKDGNIYLFEQAKSFWFIETGNEVSLNFEPLKKFSPIVIIPLSDIELQKLHPILTKYLPEQKREEGWIDRTSKRLKL